MTYTVTIREGVTSSQRQALHLRGCAVQLRDHRSRGEHVAKLRVSMISAIETPTTAQWFTLASVFTPFSGLSPGSRSSPPTSRTRWATPTRQTIGTPYRFIEWIQGDQIVLERFERYWEEGLCPPSGW